MIEHYDLALKNLPAINAVTELDYKQALAEIQAKINAEDLTLVDGELKPLLQKAELLNIDSSEFWLLKADDNCSRYALDLPLNALSRTIHISAWYLALHQQNINEAIRAVMLATAMDGDLDNVAIVKGIERLNGETDEAFRKRLVMHPESLGKGTAGSYEFYALGADETIKQALVTSPNPCEIVIYLLSNKGNGTVSDDVKTKVLSAVTAPENHVLGDYIQIKSAEIVEYTIDVKISFYPNSNQAQVIQDIIAKYADYKNKTEHFAHPIDAFHINNLLCNDNIKQLTINQPNDVVIGEHQAPSCTKLTINGVIVA